MLGFFGSKKNQLEDQVDDSQSQNAGGQSPVSNQMGPKDPQKNVFSSSPHEHGHDVIESEKNEGSQRDPLNEEEKVVSSKFQHLAQSLKKKPQILKPVEEKQQKPGIYSLDDLKDLKYLLSTEVAIPLNTNIMRIALNFQEEKIARYSHSH